MVLVVLIPFASGCASSGAISQQGQGVRPRPSADVITLDEIQRGDWQNAYELIRALRPRWLRAHGPDSILGETPDIQVHVDGSQLGGTNMLRGISASDITSIRFVDPVSAAAQWGGDHANGAIIISTKS